MIRGFQTKNYHETFPTTLFFGVLNYGCFFFDRKNYGTFIMLSLCQIIIKLRDTFFKIGQVLGIFFSVFAISCSCINLSPCSHLKKEFNHNMSLIFS